MVAHYWKQQPLSRENAEVELQKLIAWELEHGYAEDLTAEQLGTIAKEYYGFSYTTSAPVSVESIEAQLQDGIPVIVPAAGRELGNPYFSGTGPWYHMLVITGYDDGRFITNDPGTKRGQNFVYDKHVLLSAIHDWAGVKEEIRTGKKTMLVVTP